MTTRLRLGYLDPFRPFCWREGNTARGSFIDALATRLSNPLSIDWQPGDLAELPALLATGQIDAIAAKAITPARAGLLTFSEPLLQTAAALFAAAGGTAPALTCAGTAVIATPASGPLPGIIRQQAPRSRLLLTKGYDDTLAALLSGRADLAALNADAGTDLAQRRFPGRFAPAGPRFAPLGLAIATPPGDPAGVLAALGLVPCHLA
ncbi:MAG: substrate-binding periplasmic protein [Pararhodobacter sp.]